MCLGSVGVLAVSGVVIVSVCDATVVVGARSGLVVVCVVMW